MKTLDKRNLYRLPWSMNDNPIAWLEITDTCNVHCLGCYRQQVVGHKPLAEVKDDILFLKRWRNAHNVSIAGGEPLIHPEILDIVAFTREQGMEPLILTNGRALTRELLWELKRAGAMGIAFHIDSLQQREPRWNGKTEAELNQLREEMMELVASVPGMYCNFGLTVYRSNLAQIPEVVRWCQEHIDKVHGMVFITFRAAGLEMGMDYYTADGRKISPKELGYAFDRQVAEDAGVTSQELWELIRSEFPHYDASAYLNGTQRHDSIKWLIGLQLGLKGGHMFGSIGPRSAEAFETWHHWSKGTYVAHRPNHRIGRKVFLAGVFDRRIRTAHRAYWRTVLRRPRLLFSPVYLQAIGIIQAPDVLADGRMDMCDGCPDMCVNEGTLVHSCRWDEWRLYGGYMQARPQAADVSNEERIPEQAEESEDVAMPV